METTTKEPTMSIRHITARDIQPDMTLLIDGQHHVVDAAEENHWGDAICVQAETVVGDMGPRTFEFEPAQQVSILA
jgi:hypothetical protein